jgi:DNA replication and repair protein RecF
MSLESISISNVRCIEQADLLLSAGLTLIWGDNGSGKTSLLEAMFMLGRGRSFRTRNNERLIRRGQDHLRVTGRVSDTVGQVQPIAIEVTAAGSSARVAGKPAQSLAELSPAFPVQIIEPGVHKLVEEGGRPRRRWIDWAVFHVEPQFGDAWSRYTRALKQRNASLRSRAGEAGVWDAELARLGELISTLRHRVLGELQPHWKEVVAALSGLDVELHYARGWSEDQTLLEALAATRSRDQARQLTHAGPHRADVSIRLSGRPAREVLSRGQQKLVAVAMVIAQLRLLQEATQTTPTLLLDDPAAELDAQRLERFIGQVGTLRCQLVVTSLHAESRLFGAPQRTFRVVQGGVQPV